MAVPRTGGPAAQSFRNRSYFILYVKFWSNFTAYFGVCVAHALLAAYVPAEKWYGLWQVVTYRQRHQWNVVNRAEQHVNTWVADRYKQLNTSTLRVRLTTAITATTTFIFILSTWPTRKETCSWHKPRHVEYGRRVYYKISHVLD